MNKLPVGPAIWAVVFLMSAWACSARAGESAAAFSIQGVQASEQGKNAEKPQIDESLAAFKGLLRSLGYGKYIDAGKGTGSAELGKTATVVVAGLSAEISPTTIRGGVVSANVVVKKEGKQLGQMPLTLKPGEPVVSQFGTPAAPMILIFELGK